MPRYRAQYEREQLSARLRELRHTSGLSSAVAARTAGFSQSKLSKIETGALLPSFADSEALCAAYHAPGKDRDEVLDLVAVRPLAADEETIRSLYAARLPALYARIKPER